MTQFHEGQEVEVQIEVALGDAYDAPMSTATEMRWRKAKIVEWAGADQAIYNPPERWIVQFPDGSRAVFDAEHIRAVATLGQKVARDLGEGLMGRGKYGDSP